MAIVINGSGTISGISAGGLPAGTVTSATLAAGAGGKILQIVEGSTVAEAGITTQTLTDSNLSATITPSAATSKVLVLVNQHYTIYRHDDDNNGGIVLLRGTTIIGEYLKNSSGHYWGVGGDWQASGADRVEMRLRWNFSYLDTPNTTSATTYKTQGATYSTSENEEIKFQRNSSGTDAASYMQLMEVAA
jgi:hypothetical protein